MAYIYSKPDLVRFNFPLLNEDDIQKKIIYTTNDSYIKMESEADFFYIHKDHLAWVIKVLEDVLNMHKATLEKEK